MKCVPRSSAVALSAGSIAVLLAAGCSDGAALPNRPGPVPVSASGSTILTGGAATQDVISPNGERASGHIVVHGTEVQGVKDESYSFSARRLGDSPLATGTLSGHFLRFDGTEVKVKADVTCLVIADNQAWVGMRLTRLVRDGVDQPVDGFFPVLRVLDAGEGHGVVDQASLLFFGSQDNPRVQDDMSYCSARPEFPRFFDSAIANIQVTTR